MGNMTEDKWISVKDRLPPINQSILVYFPTEDRGSIFEVKYYGENSWDILSDTYPNSCNYNDFKPTHWMPLPEPPKDL